MDSSTLQKNRGAERDNDEEGKVGNYKETVEEWAKGHEAAQESPTGTCRIADWL